MPRDLTLHIIHACIAGERARVYSCNKREATTFARRTGGKLTSACMPASWRNYLTYDRSSATRQIDPPTPTLSRARVRPARVPALRLVSSLK